MKKNKALSTKKRNPLVLALDSVAPWTGEKAGVITVGGWKDAKTDAERRKIVGKGGYIWIGGERGFGFVSVYKLLRLTRTIERLRKPTPPRPRKAQFGKSESKARSSR